MKNTKPQKTKVIAISVGHFLHDIYSSFLAPMLPLLIEKLGISLSMVAILDVVRKIPSLFNPLIGIIADRAGLKYMLILSPIITGVSMSLLGIAPSYPILIILLFIAGISTALFHVPSPVMVKQFSGEKTATSMSYYMFGGEIARTLGPLIITAAISLWGLEGSYKVFPVSIMASAMLFYFLKDIKYVPQKAKKQTKEAKKTERKKHIPLFTGISGFMMFRAGMKSALTLYLVVYMVDHGASLWIASISLSILQLSGAVGTIFAGYVSDRIKYKPTLLITAIASPILMLGFIYIPSLAILFLVLIGFFLFSSTPVILAIVQDQATGRPAFFNGIYMTISFAFSSLMVLLVGFLGDKFGLDITMKITCALAFFAVPFVFLFPEKKKNI
jgi:MFS transporter, FSR family, fosmidomycin resistance protein